MEKLRLGLIYHGRSLVLLENAFSAMASLNSKFVLLNASLKEKINELGKAQEENHRLVEEMQMIKGELHQARDVLRQEREELRRVKETQAEQAIEIRKLRTDKEILEGEKALLGQQLHIAEESNTRLGLENSKLHTREYVDSISNYSYICAFADALRASRQTLSAEQISPLKAAFEKYMIDNPPDRNLPLSDLRDLCDFSMLPAGVEIEDPISDEEDDQDVIATKEAADKTHIGEQEDRGYGEHDGEAGVEQSALVGGLSGQENVTDGTKAVREDLLSHSLPPTPNDEFIP